MGVFPGKDKVVSLAEMVGTIPDGCMLAIGGGLSLREPMAIVRELIRQGKKGFHVVGTAHGFDIDLLASVGAISRSQESYVGYEQDFGSAPHFRRALESGQVEMFDTCCYTLVQQLRAAEYGVPFMPVRSIKGTDFLRLHPEFKRMTCPFTGQELILVPAIEPDVAVVHAQYGDRKGNLLILPPLVADLHFVRAAKRVLATVEILLDEEEMADREPNVPYFQVEAVSVVPYGAHPTSCYPFYTYDKEHLREYMTCAKGGAESFFESYVRRYILEARSPEAYVEAVGGVDKFRRLGSWSESDAAWMDLYQVQS